MALAKTADVALLYLGLAEVNESEGNDRLHMNLAQNQNDVVAAVAAVNPNVVVVLSCGSAVELPWCDKVSAIVHGYLGGREAVGGKPTYVYYFDRKQIEPDGDSFSEFGAYHAADLFYLFGTLYRNRRPYTETDFRISKAMVDYISNFCMDGDPNGEGLAQWKSITADSHSCMNFGDEPCGMVEPDEAALIAQQKKGILFPALREWNPGDS